jgi:CheY-like chemotaxis protein
MAILREGTSGEPVKRLQGANDRRRVRRKCEGPDSTLRGLRELAKASSDMSSNWSLLVVEDEPLIAMLLVDLLDELGCTVAAQASSVAEGLDRTNDTPFDAAILDVNLRGQPVWPLADALQEKGIRFVLATGYDGRQTQRRYPSAAVLAKPYALQNLRQALDALKDI